MTRADTFDLFSPSHMCVVVNAQTLASITAVISFFASTKRFAVQVDYSGLTSISSVLDTLVSFILALYIRRAVVWLEELGAWL